MPAPCVQILGFFGVDMGARGVHKAEAAAAFLGKKGKKTAVESARTGNVKRCGQTLQDLPQFLCFCLQFGRKGRKIQGVGHIIFGIIFAAVLQRF